MFHHQKNEGSWALNAIIIAAINSHQSIIVIQSLNKRISYFKREHLLTKGLLPSITLFDTQLGIDLPLCNHISGFPLNTALTFALKIRRVRPNALSMFVQRKMLSFDLKVLFRTVYVLQFAGEVIFMWLDGGKLSLKTFTIVGNKYIFF